MDLFCLELEKVGVYFGKNPISFYIIVQPQKYFPFLAVITLLCFQLLHNLNRGGFPSATHQAYDMPALVWSVYYIYLHYMRQILIINLSNLKYISWMRLKCLTPEMIYDANDVVSFFQLLLNISTQVVLSWGLRRGKIHNFHQFLPSLILYFSCTLESSVEFGKLLSPESN